MPSVSKDQQIAMAIAKNAPEKLYARNKGLLKMSGQQLDEFARTPRKNLPKTAASGRKNKAFYGQ
jgi:hypothetical protein